MQRMFETLEGRRLLAGHGGSDPAAQLLAKADGVDDPAVVASVAAVQADQAAIAAAKDGIRTDAADTRETLAGVKQDAAAQLFDARQAVKDAVASGDQAAVTAAREALRALRQQLRSDIAAARQAVREDTADGRAALKDALTSLRDHLKQLRTDLQAAGVIPTRSEPPTAPAPENSAGANGNNANQPPGAPVDPNVPNPIDGDRPDGPPTGSGDTGVPNPNGDQPNRPPTGPGDTGIPNPNGDDPNRPPRGPADTNTPNPDGDRPDQPPPPGPVGTGIPNPNGDNPDRPPTGPGDTNTPNPDGDNPDQPPTGPGDGGGGAGGDGASVDAAIASLFAADEAAAPDGSAAGSTPQRVVPDITLTPEDALAVADAIREVAGAFTTIDQTKVDELTNALSEAAADSTITGEERRALRGSAIAVVRSIDFEQENVWDLARQIHRALRPALVVPTPDITLTPEDAQAAADKIREIASAFTTIDTAAVDTLAEALVEAAADSTLTAEERVALKDDAVAVIRSIDFTQEDLRAVAQAIREMLGLVNLGRPRLGPPPVFAR